MRETRAQSAMEYLMTYGWAILIIAVVLAVLFTLGIFNANTYGGRAHSGSCTVQRPYGPGTTQLISMAGVCNGQIPQFVALMNGNGDGVGSYVDVPYQSNLATATFTVTMWVMLKGPVNSYPDVISNGGNGEYTMSLCTTGGASGSRMNFWINNLGNGNNCAQGGAIYYNRWYFEALTYNGFTANQYQNNTLVYTQSFATTPSTSSDLIIGGYPGATPPGRWNGSIADVQVYSTALTSNEVNSIYLEGIGGAPISLQNLAGWWPLNGDGNDYSGNGYNGALSNVIWTSQWTNGYLQP
ncbi:MAG: LamG domain-containing protein [Candidatus Micrarchaeota archaeon]|nr:LamG domain-containing protein [Candidatus Micrarchaeota archaeon]